ncbi:MAG: hypothetical protein J6J74_02265, partial [Elusimicrobiaceae bacterium]|nr:hypothetical protein [Elusimicrobiaceae bacterium]
QSKYPGQAIGPHWRRVRVALDGGDGSGNFGHEGRPGKVGGSGEGGGKQQERNTKKSKTADEFFGPAFTAYSGKPAQAINYLLKVKKGHVPAAIYKEGIGNIDLVYGEGGKYGYGLAHIIEEREKDGINGVEFVKRIPSLIDAGILNRQNERFGRIYVETKKEKAVVRLDYDKEARNWLLTAFIKEDS